jgi:hypothetical protein
LYRRGGRYRVVSDTDRAGVQGGRTVPRTRRDRRPLVEAEGLEPRLAPSTPMPAPVATTIQDTLAALQAFTAHYPSRLGNANYDPAFDLNHNGQIGQDDGKLLLHSLPPVSPPIPLSVQVNLAPADQAHGSLPHNSGGITHHRQVTVLGHTSPGALVFTGTGTIDLKLHGPAYVADAQGNFKVPLTMKDGINQFDVQAVDAYGRQSLRAYPIYWLDFAAYENAHPRKT